jgi:hypothetical protein
MILALNPLQTARSEIRGWAKSGHFPQHLVHRFRSFEGDTGHPVVVAIVNRENLAADFPNIGATPLHDMSRGWQAATELIEIIWSHRAIVECSDSKRCSATWHARS